MRLLVIRTSAMGDVALLTPVLNKMISQYPDTEITLLTRSSFIPFFRQSDKLKIYTPDFRERHKGLPGIIRLYSDIKKLVTPDHIIDLHDVIRSKILRFLFLLNRIPVSVIDKGRMEKRNLITGKRKVQLKHSVIRYSEVFANAGFILTPDEKQTIVPAPEALRKAEALIDFKTELNIGIAPYALHKLKMWPDVNMISLMNLISEYRDVRFFLFGGPGEYSMLDEIAMQTRNSLNLAGKYSLEEELAVMSKLDFMIAMDSSNMHMAALVGTKVISIWGGTDPLNGFGAWMQPESYSIKIPVDELTCRPCTIFGKGECRRGDLACMNWLTPEKVLHKILKAGLLG